MSDDKRCGTCRWWECREYTPTGRPKRNTSGTCNFLVKLPPMPEAITADLLRSSVWADYGTDCPCYERKERDEREGTD